MLASMAAQEPFAVERGLMPTKGQTMEFDLTDPECFARQDPHPVFKRLRAEDPIHWTTGRIQRGFWSITRYEDALAVYRDPVTFSSQRYSVGLPSNPEAEAMLSPEMRGCGQMLIGT